VTDDRELAGLDPYDLLDEEAARLDAFFSGLSDEQWRQPSRCEGWTVRDVLSHLASGEDYHRACLDGAVADLFAKFAERGVTDLHTANALGVSDYNALSAPEAIEHWRAADADTRRRFRERGDGKVDTSVGEYPARWQAFHVASELATHADDVGVPIKDDDERRHRLGWRVPFSRFALTEVKPDLTIRVDGERTVVGDGATDVELDGDELVEAVAGRLDASSRLDDTARTMLSTTP